MLWIVYDEKCKKEGPVNETFDRSVFFQLSSRDKFDLENIGSMYAKTTRANKNDAEKYGILFENLSETGIAHVNFSGYIFRCNFCFIIFSDKMFSCIYLIKHIHIYK